MISVLRSLSGLVLVLVVGGVLAAEPERNLRVQNQPPTSPGRVALVVGNAAYPGAAALRNPVNDAQDIAAKLRKLGFDVTLKTDLGLREMLRALTGFGEKVSPGAEVLFYYAGHGMQVRGKNYLVPVDAEIRTESSVSSEAVDVDQLLDKLAAARLSMVILDACRNNPFERRFRGGGQGLAFINAPSGTLIAYATAPGRVAADGDGRNGLYTQELLAAMDTPGIKVEDVFKRVRANVARATNESQIPWEASSLTGDFYFAGAGTAAPAVPSRPPGDDGIELAFWDAVKDSERAGDIQRYLSQYPNGRFAALASMRIEALRSNSPPGNGPGTFKTIQLRIGEQLDKVSMYPMQVCDYSRPLSSILDETFRRLATEKSSGVDFVGDTAEAVLDIRPLKASLAKAAGQDSDYLNTMRLTVESRLSIGAQVLWTKTYEERSTRKYASCCSCSAWDDDINSELKKIGDSLVGRLLGDLSNARKK